MTKFYGIGVGPGDKELLTVKAIRALSILDVLLVPGAKMCSKSIAYDIAKDYIKTDTEIISIVFPMVENYEVIMDAAAKAAKVIEKNIMKGKNVGFITLGDPSIFSTYGYVLKNLDRNVSVETIPGITSFCAAAALLNKPLIEREEILSIIPSTASADRIEQAVKASGGMAFMKVYNHSKKISEILSSQGLLVKSTLIRRCGLKDCSIDTDIDKALDEKRQYLSIILTRRES